MSNPLQACPLMCVQQDHKLCSLCTDVLIRWFSNEDDSLSIDVSPLNANSDRPDLDIIRKSSQEGCRLCSEVLHVFSTKVCNAYSGTTQEEGADEAVEAVALTYPRLSINMIFQSDHDPPHYLLVYRFAFRDVENIEDTQQELERDTGLGSNLDQELLTDDVTHFEVLLNFLKSKYIPQNLFPAIGTVNLSDTTASDSSWSLILHWLDHCTVNHMTCNQPLSTSRDLPKRLINVGDESNPPFLCLSKDLVPATLYVTLSHCWGDAKITTLTSDSMRQFLKEIPMKELPQTFQDAITITRLLRLKYGIQHLWIDSLCIQQDSLEEWREEAPRMAEVYGNCWCNIAATGGGGHSGRPPGVFCLRNPELLRPLQVSTTLSDGGNYICFNDERWGDYVKNSPLNARAWVCQERLLSPRVLHFGVGEIYWECSEGRASETFPRGELTVYFENPSGEETLVRAQLEVEDIWQSLNSWLDVVDIFTSGALTRPSDKLFAIAGLARIFQPKLGGSEYLAGIWREDLERQLLWRVSGLGITTRGQDYRAPTWCWASINGPILSSWAPENCEVLVKILGVHMTSVDPFNDISAGVLQIQGRLLKGRTVSDARYFPGLRLNIDKAMNQISFHPDEFVDSMASVEIQVLCLPLSYEKAVFDIHEQGFHLRGLVLQLSNSSRGQYRRIGVFETDITEEINTIMHGQIEEIEDSEYEDWNGVDLFTISII